MATVTQRGLIEGSSYVGEGTAPIEQTDVFLIEGIEGDGTQAHWQATTAGGLPLAWSVHPYTPGLNAVRFVPQLLGAGKARVSVTYVNTQPQFVMRGGCGLYQTTTDMDRYKRPVWVTNRGATLNGAAVTDDNEQWQSGTFSVAGSETVFMFERVRPLPTFAVYGVWPQAHAEAFTGKLNATAFFGYGRGMVLCENVAYDNSGMAGVANRFTYEFRVRPVGWQPEVAWINSKTGEPLPDLQKAPQFDQNVPSDPGRTDSAAYGRKVVYWFDYVDFNALLN